MPPARLSELADIADKNPPVLQQFDKAGDRVDRISYHPAYLELCRAAYNEYGLSAMSHRKGLHGWDSVHPPLAKYLASYIFVQAEFGLACPVSMTDAAARTLRMFGDPAVFSPWIDALTSTDPEQAKTGAMFMTEIQAGTDIACTETRAERDGDGWVLTGKKWFASNPDADVIITLARFPGGQDGSTRGVGMFMVPKTLGSGERNNLTIDRLKDKLGTRSMPSGEVTLNRAHALQVGELDRGFRQMAEMVNTSRLSNAMRSSALMRRAVREAVEHSKSRVVFGKRLFDQPLMRATLLPLALDAEASLALVAYQRTVSSGCRRRGRTGARADQGTDADRQTLCLQTRAGGHRRGNGGPRRKRVHRGMGQRATRAGCPLGLDLGGLEQCHCAGRTSVPTQVQLAPHGRGSDDRHPVHRRTGLRSRVRSSVAALGGTGR